MSGGPSGGAGGSPSVVPTPPPFEATPRWPVWILLGLLVLPFHPLWVDFEQVRRGLLLVSTGACLVAMPRLRPVRGEAALYAFAAYLAGCGLLRWLGDEFLRDPNTPASFQPWDACYRLAHWLALLVVLRLGSAWRSASALPFAGVLLATSGFGLVQRAGLGEFAGYGVEREPVSVFGNLNVASEWTAIAAMVVAVCWPQFRGRAHGVAIAALGLAGAYLVVNQSRSGLIALPVGLVLLALLRRRERGFVPLLPLAAGALVGFLLHAGLSRPAPLDAAAAKAELQRGTNTLQVRFEIARGTTRLFGESPIFGHGPGQFAVHYPRFRSQDEIEMSSHGRQFAVEVRTAHDDWLELLVDGGLGALVLFAALLFVLQRGQRDKAQLLPLFVLLLLMLVRAPLGNAPAAVAALWLCGAPADDRRERAWQRPLALVVGFVLVVLGCLPVAANCAIAPFQRAARLGQPTPRSAAANAAWWMPFEPRWLQLQARSELRGGDLANARRHAAAAVALRPFDPQAYELLVEVLVRGKAFDHAATLVRFALQLDPVHPELRMWRSWLAMQRGAVDEAIAAVAERPHPRLREQLAEHFSALASASSDAQTAARFATEQHFVAALDGLGQKDQPSLDATKAHIQQMMQAMQTTKQRDVRPLLLGALNFLDRGLMQDAIDYGGAAGKLRPLQPWQRELFGAQLERLRSFEVWQPVLDAR